MIKRKSLGELNMTTSKVTAAPTFALYVTEVTDEKPGPVSEYPTLHTTMLKPRNP